MAEDRLGIPHRAMLLALMAEAREISNTELKERWRLTIVDPYRTRLNDLKFVTSRRKGNGPFLHELTERGWKWCVDELTAGVPTHAGRVSSAERALYAVLSGLARHLERQGLTLGGVFKPDAEPVDVEARIRNAYRDLAAEPHAWVSLTDLRPLLGDVPKAEVDEVLVKMDGTPEVTIIPEANRKTLTAADRAAAVRIGNEDNHLLSIGEA